MFGYCHHEATCHVIWIDADEDRLDRFANIFRRAGGDLPFGRCLRDDEHDDVHPLLLAGLFAILTIGSREDNALRYHVRCREKEPVRVRHLSKKFPVPPKPISVGESLRWKP